MRSALTRTLKHAAVLLAVAVLTVLGGPRLGRASQRSARALAHLRAEGAARGRSSTRADWAAYLEAEDAVFASVRARGHRAARAGRARPDQSLLRRRSDLPRPLRARTGTARSCSSPKEPRSARWCCCTGSRTRPTACGRSRERYREHGFVAIAIRLPGARHRAGRAHRRRLAGLGRRHAARGARGACAARTAARCTWSATRTAARWRCSTRSMRSTTSACRGPRASC